MNKTTQFKRYIFLLFSVLLLGNVFSQEIQSYKNGQLQGTFKIKLKPDLVISPSGLKSTSINGYSSVGIEKIDVLNIQYQAVKLERLIPYSPLHHLKHRKHGLDLWYKVEIESEAELEQVIQAYSQLMEIETAEPFYEKSLVPHNLTKVSEGVARSLSNSSTSPYDDPMFIDQWHYHNTIDNVGTPGADINLLKAWEKQVGHPDVIVAVIDQGVDYSHEDLAANMWVNEAELNGTPGEDSDGNGYIDDVYGYDFVNMEGDVKPLPHGTHVAGTVAAVNNNGIGVAGVAGGSGNNDGVRIMSCMIMSENSAGSAEAAFVYAADNGAVIAQNSWGWNTPGVVEQSILDAIDYFIEEAGQHENSPMKGGVVIFAAGNNGDEGEYWPGCYEKVIAVASSGNENQIVPYSNYGDWLDISAPGGFVDKGQEHGVLSTMPDNSYGFYDGTSMACPHVSGVAGLIVSEYKGETFHRDMLTARLLGGVNVIDTMEVNKYYSGKVGLGALDAYLALQVDNGIAPDQIVDYTFTGASSSFAYFSWTVPADEDDDLPRFFKVYTSTEAFDQTTLEGVDFIQINNLLQVGDLMEYELKNLDANTQYYTAISAQDRWGNESVLSEVLNFQTNNGPGISLDKTKIDFTIDVTVDTLSKQQFTISNIGEGLLKWDLKTRHIENVDIYNSIEPRSLYKVNLTNQNPSGFEEHTVNHSELITPFAQKPETRYMFHFDGAIINETMVTIGESNRELTNSSATRFKVYNPLGWNLTGTEVGFFINETPQEPLYVEVYEGNDLATARLIHSQSFLVDGGGLFFETIQFDKQMYFKEGEEFFIVFHLPPGHKFPFLASQGRNLASTEHSYFSSDQGASWHLLKDVYYDYTKVWDVIALNNWVELEPYVSYSSSNGYIKPGDSEVVDVTVNASKLINGDYKAKIEVYGVGYEDDWESLDLNFKVEGQTHHIESEDIVNYGNVFIGESEIKSINLSNTGLAAFYNNGTALNIEISDPDFYLVGNMPNVIPGERSVDLEFRFKPSREGAINAVVKVSDKDGKVHAFSLFGVGSMPAKAVVSPPVSTMDQMNLGDNFEGSFYLRNDGDYPLKYYIPKFADGSNLPGFDPNSIHQFGYVAGQTLSEPNQPAFDWEDIQWSGVDITDNFRMDGSVILEEALIGFSFPYFGNEYDTCYISKWGAIALSNDGWFNANPAGYKNPAQPAKLISAWGMKFELKQDGKILYQKFPGKFVLQYNDVIHGSYIFDDTPGSPGWSWLEEKITFQIVLHQNGDIDFNYLDLGEIIGTRDLGFNRASALIMIEDQTIDDRVVLNGYGTNQITQPFIEGIYPATGQQIYFKNPGFGVLSEVTNPFGTVHVNDSVKIEYKGSTTDLYVADFEERINVVSNDPINNPVTHTIQLNITTGGEAQFTFDKEVIDFGEVFEGAVHTINLKVGNDGKAIGQFETMAFANELFSIDGYMPVELRPNTFAEYTITVVADQLGLKSDVLTFTTPSGDTYALDVMCEVVEAPVISSPQESIIASLSHGEQITKTVTINNDGLNAMQVSPVGNEWMHILPDNESGHRPEVEYVYTIEHDKNSPYYNNTGVVETGDKLETPGDVLDPKSFWMTVPMPFEVNYYGQQYDTLYVGVTGVMTFLPDQPTREWGPNDYIPHAGGVDALLAPLFGFNGLSNPKYYPKTGIYTKAFDDKFVIRYQDMGSNGGGAKASVEVWLFKNGIIKYIYDVPMIEDAFILFENSIVGLENQDGTKGIQVAARTTNVITDGTIVTFLPKDSYTIPAQSTMDFDVNLNAKSLYGGLYTDNLVFENNTPAAPDFSIPVELEVIGQDNLEINDTLNLGTLMMVEHDNDVYTSPYKRYDYNFTLRNNGSRAVNISKVKIQKGFSYGITMGDDNKFGNGSSDDGWTDVSRKILNYSLKPLETETFRLRVYPLKEAIIADTILIECDLANSPLKLPVSAVFSLPPAVNIQSDGIHVYANDDKFEETRTFVVDNNAGSMPLDFEVSLEFERNVSTKNRIPTGAVYTQMPGTDIGKLEVTKASSFGVKTNAQVNEEFNQVLQHDNTTVTAGNTGFGSNNMSFACATAFNAPETGFSLSHVQTWYAWEQMLDSDIEVTILGGSEDFFECEVLYTQRYTHLTDYESINGELITIELDRIQYFFPNEKFFVMFKYDEFLGFPQGTIVAEEPVYQRYYFGDGNDMFETTDKGYGTLGWFVRAAEKEANNNAWTIINNDGKGSINVGEEKTFELGFNSLYAKQGINIASVVLKSNDPYNSTVKLPVSLTRNKGPQYADGDMATYSIFENDTLEYTLMAFDEEGDDFTIQVPEERKYFSYELNDKEVNIVFTPDFDGAGHHELVVEGVDSYGNSTQFTLKVDVENVNRAPVEIPVIGEQVFAIETEDAYLLHLDDYFVDPDGDAMTIEASFEPNEAVDIMHTNSTLAFNPINPGYVFVNVSVTDALGAVLNTGFPVFIEHRVGINDKDYQSIQLYPNPADEVVYLNFNDQPLKDAKAELVNSAGEIIKVYKLANNQQHTLNIGNISSGVYMLKVYTENTVLVHKLIKR